MHDSRWTVIGGWSLPPQLLSGIFGNAARYIDSNDELPGIFENEHLPEHWPQILADQLFPAAVQPDLLAGWSTGAIIAAALAPIIKPKALLLFSSTPSFVRRDSFLHGTRTALVSSMIKELASDCNGVLKQFYTRCGFTDLPSQKNYSVISLQKGLFFLQQANLLTAASPSCPVICMHGISDAIIPLRAGQMFCEKHGGTMYEIAGAHQFFLNETQKIKSIIDVLEK